MRVVPVRRSIQVVSALWLALAACRPSAPPVRYGFLALLGRDTVSLERVTRTADTLVSDEVDRFPRVRRRHTRIVLGAGGAIRHLEIVIETPSESPAQRTRHVVADVANDMVKISKRDKTGVVNLSFPTAGGIAMAHLPQMYSLTDLYFGAALARAQATRLAAGGNVPMRQFYIDREFDRFPLHTGHVRPLPGNKAELWHDWLAGFGEATFDSSNHMLTYSGARSTYKIEVKRLTEQPDVESVGAQFAARETQQGGMVQLSVRDTARAAIGTVNFAIDYGRPLARGRTLLGNIIPYDQVWRTGANAATQFTTSAPIEIAGIHLAAGQYTLWTVPHANGAELIVNSQTGQWGTGYDGKFDVVRHAMTTEVLPSPVEKFAISIIPAGPRRGSLVMEWGTFRWTAPITVP